MSETQAWTALLGLDAFDHFSCGGSPNGFPYLASSTADAFLLTPTNFSMPNEPPISHETPRSNAGASIQASPVGDGLLITPSRAADLHGNFHQPWHPPLPSLGPETSPVRISDSVISRLRNSVGEEDRRTLTPTALRYFLGTYFDVFNVHLPLLHEPSFDFDNQPLGLLFAMAAIGAMYRLDRRSLAILYQAADSAAPVGAAPIRIASFHRSSPGAPMEESTAPGRWSSLSYYQTRLLLQYVGILGGDSELADRSLGMIAELSLTLYRTLARQLKASGSVSEEDLTWSSWLDMECTKRTLYGVWNLSDFVASTYGIAPPLTVGHDGELELPCPEAMWQARTEVEWNEARIAEAEHRSAAATTVRDACALIVDHHDDQELSPNSLTTALRWSPFAVVCIMHILATRLWHVSHGTLSSVATTLRPVAAHSTTDASSSSNTTAPGGGGATSSLLATGRRCHDLIRAYSEHIERDSTLRHTKDARWQLANAADVLRVCYGRTVPALARLDCDTLLRGGQDDVHVAIEEHVAASLERTAEFTLAAAVAFEGLCAPLRYGAQLYRKTGALNGSLESLVAGWDNALLVSKWTHVACIARALGTELDHDEMELLQSISAMLRQEEPEPDHGSSLAARLLRYWAAFYEGTWVWGVAPRMAVVLRKLASAYESGQG